MQRSLLNPKRFEGLFSEHYVRNRFPETDLYKKLTPTNEIRKKVSALILKVIKTTGSKNEAQLEEDFIQPLLNILGIRYIVQVNTPAGTADYAFFESEKDRAAADGRRDKKYEGAVAIADAKRWERPLDAPGGAEPLDKNPNAVPTKQIANYIYDTAVDWGVLTDGRLWRLYNRNTTPVSQSFFEINLIEGVEDPEVFHLFYALFSGAAFAEKAQEFVLKESENYWAEIGEDLKEKAYKALELLCNGFRKLGPDLEIKDIYEGAVILLYRLLFILYAENKNLLPRGEEAYRRYSLQEILKEVERGAAETFSETRPMLYDRLSHLFRLIDEGDDSLRVYQYNGGLFKDEGLPFLPANFLAERPVPDRYLAEALKLIAYAQDKKGRGRHLVDYGELDVRHLGSIYEGLLEFHPTVKNDKIELYTDKGERKATGSYYTPGYIVDYIVENTLGPLTEKMATPEEVIEIKVLDPAMGSGHFLVGAVDFIGRRCVELAGEEAEKTEKDYQREAVERCIYGVDLNPLAVELAKLSLWLHTVAKDKPLSFLDHHLKLGNSLVGGRVTDLAEIPAKGKKKDAAPTQNLFATRLEQAMATAMNEVMGILGRGTEAIDDITFKEDSLKRAETRLAPYKAVADTWVSTYFGNDVTADEYDAALATIGRPKDVLAMPKVAAAIKLSHGDEHGVGREFFHWELEFPEVFFDDFGLPKDNPGFDAVIGNPPYVNVKAEGIYAQLKTAPCTNLYSYFIETGIGCLKHGARFGMIVPLSLVCSSRMNELREYVSAFTSESRVSTFAKRPASVFAQVQQRVSILLSEKNEEPFRLFSSKYNRWYKGEELAMIKNLSYIQSTVYIKDQAWPKLGDKFGASILDKLLSQKKLIQSYLGGKKEFYYHSLGMYWVNAYTFKPVFKDASGYSRDSTNLKILTCPDLLTRDLLVGIINSSLFYFYWIVYSDDFHLLKSEIERFPIEIDAKKYGHVYDMISLKVKELMKDFKKNSFLRRAKMGADVVVWQELRPSLSKPILDELDTLISMLYGLTDDDTQYIIHYDERFRMGEGR
jgi:type I restriction-modification system DNA methylase subunit